MVDSYHFLFVPFLLSKKLSSRNNIIQMLHSNSMNATQHGIIRQNSSQKIFISILLSLDVSEFPKKESYNNGVRQEHNLVDSTSVVVDLSS